MANKTRVCDEQDEPDHHPRCDAGREEDPIR